MALKIDGGSNDKDDFVLKHIVRGMIISSAVSRWQEQRTTLAMH